MHFANHTPLSESVSIPKNPRTDRPVGYAFVDLSTPSEAERAIAELSGKEILERKVSVQLARKPDANEKTEGAGEGSGAEGTRRRQSTRGRGRAGRGRGGRARGGRGSDVSLTPRAYIYTTTFELCGSTQHVGKHCLDQLGKSARPQCPTGVLVSMET